MIGTRRSRSRLTKALERATAYVSFLSAADQAKVFGGTAAKLFKFDGP